MMCTVGRYFACALAAAALATSGVTQAKVTKITITQKSSAFGGQTFETAGAYETIRGTATGELDPLDRRNAVITDIMLAPRNANGKVTYTTTFTLLKPVDMSKSSKVMVFEVVNRGNHLLPGTLNVGTDPGDGFIYQDGHVYLWTGWQGDIPISAATGAQEGIDVPIAKNSDGSSVTGPVFIRFINVATTGTPAVRQTTQSLGGPGRTPASMDTSKAKLVSFTAETQSGVRSGEATLAAGDWAFADCRTAPFPGTPDATRVCLKNGFDPALGYQLVYTAKDPFVLGVGMAAMRDVNAFFRRSAQDDGGTANPVAGNISYAVGYGISQSGRFLKNFLNLGFNEDESGMIVWDGANPHIAGMEGQFNIRFAVPGNIANLNEPGAEGPLWWEDYDDKLRGHGVWGLLHRCRSTNTCPVITETYGGPEYWYSRGTVGIAGTTGTDDITVPSNVRRYYISGTTHGGGGGGFTLAQTKSATLMLASNPNPQREILRALFKALVKWTTTGSLPPDSVYPSVPKGTLVPATTAAMGWPNIPGAPTPDGVMNSVLDYDYGDTFRANDQSGVLSTVPPVVKQVIPTLAPTVDADGNDIAGVKTLLTMLPLGTYTGWNPVASGILKGQEASLQGGYIPFPKTKADRLASNDPRPSIEERYDNVLEYYYRAQDAAHELIAQGFLLPDDASRLMNQLLSDMFKSGDLPKAGLKPSSFGLPDE
jgi:hypothetical protein